MEIETEKDLNNLIKNKIQEDTNLDYKSPDFSKKNFNEDLAKDVSAMANSDGGTIIFGIKEENHFPKEIIWIKRDEGYKEKIEQIINSKIFRKIEGIKVKKVLSEDKKEFVIIIDIPKSDVAPHQVHKDSKQKRYYKRHGSVTEQMEHYEIEDLFFKRKRPFLEIYLRYCKSENPYYDIEVLNNGKVIAEKLFIRLLIPKEFKINGECWHDLGEKNFYSVYQYFDNIMPVYPEHSSVIGKLYTPKRVDLTNMEKFEIGFLIVSDNSELKLGKVIIEFISGEGMKQRIEYSKNKEGIPMPSTKYFWSS